MNPGIYAPPRASPQLTYPLLGALARGPVPFPSRAPATAADVSLLLHFNNERNGAAVFRDSSQYSHAITRFDGAAISTAQSRFGGSSLYTDGTNDAIQLPASGTLDFGTGPYTVELWMRTDGAQDNFSVILERWSNAPATGGTVSCGISNSRSDLTANRIAFIGFSGATNAQTLVGTRNPNDGQWHHIACVRERSNGWIFFDGQIDASTTTWPATTGASASAGRLCRSQFNNATDNNFRGWLNEFRITKAALYRAPFPVPQAPFPDP